MKFIYNIIILFHTILNLSLNNKKKDLAFLDPLFRKRDVSIYKGLYDYKKVAVKVYLHKYTEKSFLYISREILVSLLLTHPNIIEFRNFNFKYGNNACLVYELGDKTLSKCTFCSFNSVKRAIKDILLGVAHMHKNNILHNDLKHDNIVKVGCDYKIIDFGSACFFDENKTLDFYFLEECKYPHVAPEVKANEKMCFKSDVFSVGAILKYLLVKVCCAYRYNPLDKYSKASVDQKFHLDLQAAEAFCSKIMEESIEKRYTVDEALSDSWLDSICYRIIDLSKLNDLCDVNGNFKKQGNELIIFERGEEFLRIKTISSEFDPQKPFTDVYLYKQRSSMNFLTQLQIDKLKNVMLELKRKTIQKSRI